MQEKVKHLHGDYYDLILESTQRVETDLTITDYDKGNVGSLLSLGHYKSKIINKFETHNFGYLVTEDKCFHRC